MKLTKATTALLLCLFTPAGARQSDEQGGRFFYGTVRSVSGASTLGAEGAKSSAAGRVAKGMRLHGGQWITCHNRQGRCTVTVDVCDVYPRDVVIKSGAARRIPSVVCKPLAEELKKFRTAGRNDRPDRGNYLLPLSDIGVYRPETFVIRWRASARRGKLSLSIQDERGVSVWSEQVDEAKGTHSSAGMRAALERAQAEGRLNLSVTAQTASKTLGGGRYDEFQFRLIPADAEMKLSGELASWDEESGVMHHLGRAGSLSAYKLYTEAADEFERALRLSPTDIDLTRMTISAQSYALNRRRVVELCRRLRRLTPGDRHCSCTNRCES